LKAIQTKNQAAIAAEKAAQQTLQQELSTLQSQYTTAVDDIKNVQNTSTKATQPIEGYTFNATLYVLIHRDTYMDSGKLHLLTSRYGTVSLAPYTQRDVTQIFLFSSDGRIRNASGSGAYVESEQGCLAPMLRTTPTQRGTWTLKPTGEAYTSTIVSLCGSALHANAGSTVVDLSQGSTGTQWFIIPVGTSG
jgi:hypothetical protein